MDDDLTKIQEMLKQNAQVPFVRRILDPINSPVLKNKDGTVSTHSMEYAESEGRFYAYPTVMPDAEGKMKRLSSDEAWRRAMATKNVIEFATDKEAEFFTKNYKKVWGGKIPK